MTSQAADIDEQLERVKPCLPVGTKPSTAAKPSRHAVQSGGLTPKVRAAINRMIWEGKQRKAAAEASGLADESLRQALLKPLVLRFYNEQLDVLRSSARPRALQRIIELSDKSGSEKVGLDAAKYLDSEGKSDQRTQVNVQVNVSPGYMIDVTDSPSQRMRQIADQAGSTCTVLDTQADVLTEPSERDEGDPGST
jgi:hypothetical protein